LEELATSSPGLSPGEITQDPVLRGRLADNARYRALSARLEAQMAALRVD
jgi:hypothetical protein